MNWDRIEGNWKQLKGRVTEWERHAGDDWFDKATKRPTDKV